MPSRKAEVFNSSWKWGAILKAYETVLDAALC